MHFFWKDSHSFHYLLKFVKKLQITLLLTLATRSHPHSQTDYTTHIPITSFYITGPEFPPIFHM